MIFSLLERCLSLVGLGGSVLTHCTVFRSSKIFITQQCWRDRCAGQPWPHRRPCQVTGPAGGGPWPGGCWLVPRQWTVQGSTLSQCLQLPAHRQHTEGHTVSLTMLLWIHDYTHSHTHAHTHTHACTHICTHTRTHARTHTHTHEQTHTHTDTHTRRCMCVHPLFFFLSFFSFSLCVLCAVFFVLLAFCSELVKESNSLTDCWFIFWFMLILNGRIP